VSDTYDYRFGDDARFLSNKTCQQHLNVTAEALAAMVADRRILRLTTSDGVQVYPEAQLTPSGELVPGLADILPTLLRAASDEWTVYYWLTASLDDFAGHDALSVLRHGERADVDTIRAMAYEDALAWEATRTR